MAVTAIYDTASYSAENPHQNFVDHGQRGLGNKAPIPVRYSLETQTKLIPALFTRVKLV
jgi:hypothetical protein